MTQDSAEYRKALSCFATGVTVVTTHWQGSDWGITCSSFASVSLDPKLVLWSIRNEASSLKAFTDSAGFVVNVLAQSQQALAGQFAKGEMAERFSDVPLTRTGQSRPQLTEAAAWFDCTLHHIVPAGDHKIIIGEVQDFGWRDAAALGYWRSQLGEFSPLPA
jgi:flavin reductase (DIM6/NTAB) family NADH-FMN oxidoreductase RutF